MYVLNMQNRCENAVTWARARGHSSKMSQKHPGKMAAHFKNPIPDELLTLST